MDSLAVLIPCYNEEKTIGKVIRDVKRELPSAVVYVYNNNSTDRTAEIARKEGAVVREEYKQGKGNVIRRMMREIDAKCYVMIDGDDTYDLSAAPAMVDYVINKNADMVVGDRLSTSYFTENKRRFHNFGNTMVRDCINRLFGCEIKDIMTGYRAFSYDFVKTFPVLSRGFEIETEMTIHAVYHNMQIETVPTKYRDRPEGSVSKLNTFSDGMRVIRMIFNLFRNYKPFAFFGIISLILAVLAIAFFLPVFIEYLGTGQVQRFPTLIVCGFVMISAILSFFCGLLLENQAKNDRRHFEILRNMIHIQDEQ